VAGRFAVSLAAADVLGERLGIDLRVFPLQIPHVGRTDAERQQVATTALGDLAGGGLAYNGRLTPAVADALTVLARYSVAVGMILVFEGGGQQVLVRLGTDGRLATLAVQQAETIHLEFVRPTGLVPALMACVPMARQYPGSAVVFPRDDESHAETRNGDVNDIRVTEEARPAMHGYAAQRETARTMLQRRRHCAGMITIFGRRNQHTEPLVWFDTDIGRFTEHARAGADGQIWESYTPADNARLAQQVGELLAGVC